MAAQAQRVCAVAGTDAPPPLQRLTLALLLMGGVLACLSVWQAAVTPDPKVMQAFWGGTAAAGATALGTLPVMVSRRMSDRMRDALLGFGAGVMLAATSFSLVLPAIRAALLQDAGAWGAAAVAGCGILLGGALIMLLDRRLAHEHVIEGIEGSRDRARALKRTWLFVFAISLHNFPEGLAIGVAFAGTDPLTAAALATGISIQDVPEGLVVAMALRGVGYRRSVAIGLGAASGLVEPVGAVLGAAVIGLSASLLPWGLAFAGGAMLFVVSHDMIPESHRQGHETFATGGLMLGFVLMMLLDTALG